MGRLASPHNGRSMPPSLSIPFGVGHVLYSSSLLSSSSSSSADAFLAGFFFFLVLFLGLVSLARGSSRILRTSSSVIFLSVLNCDRSGVGGAASFCRPFLVMAATEGHVSSDSGCGGH